MSHQLFTRLLGILSIVSFSAWGFQADAVVTAEPASLTFPPQMVGVPTFSQNVNFFHVAATYYSAQLVDPSNSFSFYNNWSLTCSSYSPASPYCWSVIAFQPTSVGPHSATLQLLDAFNNVVVSVPLSGTGTATYPTTNTYQIIPRLSGTPPMGPDTDGAQPGVGLPTYDVAGHTWLLTAAGGNAFEISSPITGGALDVSGGSTEPGGQLIQWPYHAGLNQQWIFNPTDSGYVNIESVNSHMVLDIPGGYEGQTDFLEQWPYWGGYNQQWQLRAIGSTVPPFSGTYLLRNRASGLYLGINAPNGASYAGAAVIQNTVPTVGGQQMYWTLQQTSEGYYELLYNTLPPLLALDVPGFAAAPGVQLDVWTENDGENQQWSINPTGDGYYTIVSRSSGLVLDDSGIHLNPQNPIVQWDYWGGPNQQWQLIPVANY